MFTLIAVAAFSNVISDPSRILQEDLAFQWEGLHATANSQLSEGVFPHWNPYGMGGERLFANVLLGLLYPGSVLFRVLRFEMAYLVTCIIHYSLTAATTFAFARVVLKIDRFPAVLSACIFAYGGFCLGHVNHQNFVFGMPFLPLLLLSVYQLHSTKQVNSKWSLVTIGAFASLLLAGATPTLALAATAIAWFVIVLGVNDVRTANCRATARLVLLLPTLGAIACMLVAVQLLPTFDLYRSGARSTWTIDQLAEGGIDVRTLFYQLLAPGALGDFTGLCHPRLNHETAVFIGGTGLILAIHAVCYEWGRAWVRPLVILVVIGVVISLAGSPILKGLLTIMPIHIRQSARWVGILQFGLALLSGIGLQSWIANAGRVKRRQYVALITSAVIALVTVSIVTTFGDLTANPVIIDRWQASQGPGFRAWLAGINPDQLRHLSSERTIGSWAIMFAAGASGLAIACANHFRSRVRGAIVIVTWSTIELLLGATQTWMGRQTSMVKEGDPEPIIEFLQNNLGDERYFNAAVYVPLWENQGAVNKLANLDTYYGTGLNVSREHDAMLRSMHGTFTELNIGATKYVLLGKRQPELSLREVFSHDGISVCENSSRMPLACFVDDIEVVSTIADSIRRLSASEFDPRATMVVDRPLPTVAGKSFGEPVDWLAVRQWKAGLIEIATQTQTPRAVFLSVSFDRGWTGTCNGQPVDIVRANGCYMAFAAPAGASSITLHYQTPGLRLGSYVSFFTLIALIGGILTHSRLGSNKRVLVNPSCGSL